MQFVCARLGLRNYDGLACLAKLRVVGGGADLQFRKRIGLGSDYRLAKHGLAVVSPVQLEGDSTPISSIDAGTVYILRLLAGRRGAGGLNARYHEVQPADVAIVDRDLLHCLLLERIGDVGLLSLEQS